MTGGFTQASRPTRQVSRFAPRAATIEQCLGLVTVVKHCLRVVAHTQTHAGWCTKCRAARAGLAGDTQAGEPHSTCAPPSGYKFLAERAAETVTQTLQDFLMYLAHARFGQIQNRPDLRHGHPLEVVEHQDEAFLLG